MASLGLSFPFRVENGSTIKSEDYEKIYESIYQVLATGLGERVNEPDVGSDAVRLVFSIEPQRNFILLDVKKKLEELDDRLTNVRVAINAESEGRVDIVVSYTVDNERLNSKFTVIK